MQLFFWLDSIHVVSGTQRLAATNESRPVLSIKRYVMYDCSST